LPIPSTLPHTAAPSRGHPIPCSPRCRCSLVAPLVPSCSLVGSTGQAHSEQRTGDAPKGVISSTMGAAPLRPIDRAVRGGREMQPLHAARRKSARTREETRAASDRHEYRALPTRIFSGRTPSACAHEVDAMRGAQPAAAEAAATAADRQRKTRAGERRGGRQRRGGREAGCAAVFPSAAHAHPPPSTSATAAQRQLHQTQRLALNNGVPPVCSQRQRKLEKS